MTTYSAFFSSGLLASSHHPRPSYTTVPVDYPMTGTNDIALTKPRSFKASLTSTATRSSAVAVRPSYSAIPDDSDVEDREETPTPARMIPVAAPNTLTFTPSSFNDPASYSSSSSGLSASPNAHPAITAAMTATTTPTASSGTRAHRISDPPKPIRKRRSSITIGSSPMTAIKSPARHAEAAAQLQRHLARGSCGSMDEILGTSVGGIITGAGSGRPRSGSLGGMLSMMKITDDDENRFGSPSGGFIHTQTVGNKTMLMRMRSGSVGAKIVAPAPLPFTTANSATSPKISGALLRPRRPIRRAISNGIVPSATPPPNMPLPALPPVPPAPAPISMSRVGSPTRSVNSRSGSREATPVPNRF